MFFDDDLPVWGFIGKTEQAVTKGGLSETRFFLFTHFHFDVAYNGDRVIELNVSTVSVDPKKTLDITSAEMAANVSYSYSVKWRPTDTEFSDRMDRYSRYSFLPQHLEVS
jgi:transmembrane 9 superfamily protein 3